MKKHIKILSFVMAFVIAVGAVSVSVFAGDNDYVRYVSADGDSGNTGTSKKPWNLDDLADSAIATIQGKIDAGDRTGIIINVSQAITYEQTLVLKDLKGTAATPITVICNYNSYVDDGTASNGKFTVAEGNGIEIDGCSYITVMNADVYAPEGDGILIKNSSNVTLTNIDSLRENDSITKTMNTPVNFEGTNSNVSISGCDFSYVTAPITIDSSVLNLSYEKGNVSYSTGAALVIDGVNDYVLDGFTAKNAYFDPTAEAGAEVKAVDQAAVVIKNTTGTKFTNATITDCAGPAISIENSFAALIENVFSYNNAAFMINSLPQDSASMIRYCISSHDNKIPTVFSTTASKGNWIYNNTFYGLDEIDMSMLTECIVASNIFDMNLLGKVTIAEGNVANYNCYHNTFKAKSEEDSIQKNPQYASSTMTGSSINDFILDDDSPLIDAGWNVIYYGEKDMFGNSLKKDSHNIGAYDGIGVQVKQADEVNQTTDLIGFYVNVASKYFNDFIDSFLPESVQEQIAAGFRKFVSFVTDLIGKIINKDPEPEETVTEETTVAPV